MKSSLQETLNSLQILFLLLLEIANIESDLQLLFYVIFISISNNGIELIFR